MKKGKRHLMPQQQVNISQYIFTHQKLTPNLLIICAGVAEIILRAQSKLSLKCIAAKAVKAFNINYIGRVPTCLEGFIELHGPVLRTETRSEQQGASAQRFAAQQREAENNAVGMQAI